MLRRKLKINKYQKTNKIKISQKRSRKHLESKDKNC